MNYEKYNNVSVTSDFLEFQFKSEGPKGVISKIIQFSPTDNPNIYNLAFGNKKVDGSIYPIMIYQKMIIRIEIKYCQQLLRR